VLGFVFFIILNVMYLLRRLLLPTGCGGGGGFPPIRNDGSNADRHGLCIVVGTLYELG
jgi:hypothetical protein